MNIADFAVEVSVSLTKAEDHEAVPTKKNFDLDKANKKFFLLCGYPVH